MRCTAGASLATRRGRVVFLIADNSACFSKIDISPLLLLHINIVAGTNNRFGIYSSFGINLHTIVMDLVTTLVYVNKVRSLSCGEGGGKEGRMWLEGKTPKWENKQLSFYFHIMDASFNRISTIIITTIIITTTTIIISC